jgi:hypothetical protein
MNTHPGNPEFPEVDPSVLDDEDADTEGELDQDELPAPGEGLVEPAGVPFDEEGERVVQPEPVGD